MFSKTLVNLASIFPSSLKYRLGGMKPFYTRLMKLGQPVIEVKSVAGNFLWQIDALTCQRIVLGTYEPYMQKAFAKYVHQGTTVYDVGAHAGYLTAICSILVGSSGRVVCFEPHPTNLGSLNKQLKLNSFNNVRSCSYALSDHSGVSYLDTSSGNSQGFISDHGQFQVTSRTIDELVEDEGFDPPDVIKIDVEGHEREVLAGSKTVLEKHHPVILCDHNDDKTLPALIELLTPIGYSIEAGPPIICKPRNTECIA